MLHLPQTVDHRTTFVPKISAKKKSQRLASPLNIAVADHKAASQLRRSRETLLEKLYAAHPYLKPDLRPHFQADPAGYAEFERRCRKFGITAAERLVYDAVMIQRRALRQFINAVPTSKAEVGRYARYLMLAVRNEVGGNFYPHIGMDECRARGGPEACHEREQAAFLHLEAAFRALAKRT
ncbi:hypothetical protein AB7813_08925 [Tardiphaga sp. 20_F10_N6_6]|uniref:hypothetical protein n=1 Tax=Tardiphaga sp. 20_F10_N6_6 TaxID=3240788 RepID=UPI003F899D96